MSASANRPPGRASLVLIALAALALTACEEANLDVAQGTGPNPVLPKPNPSFIPTVKVAEGTGWPEGAGPTAGQGLAVTAFAEDLDHPRWVTVLPNGDVLVAESNAPPKPDDSTGPRSWFVDLFMKKAGAVTPSANRITLFRDADGDGKAELRSVFLQGLNSPFGMTLVGTDFYVANTDAVVRFPYEEGATAITGPGENVVNLPAGRINHHWTKNVVASPDGSRLYATVGSNSNVAEHGMEAETGRAAIWEIDPKTRLHRVFASGLRNPNGMDFEPSSGVLWTAVNERDEIGSDLVPDYMTSVKAEGFYGWPYSYFGRHVDERVEHPRPDLVEKAIVPDYALGPHTASLGLIFAKPGALPAPFANGVFIGQHGSWNRNPRSGYKVIFIPFTDGKPSGEPVDVLTGFLEGDSARGRPVGVAVDRDGALLIADDVGNKIWRVTSTEKPPARQPSAPLPDAVQPKPTVPESPPSPETPPSPQPDASQPAVPESPPSPDTPQPNVPDPDPPPPGTPQPTAPEPDPQKPE